MLLFTCRLIKHLFVLFIIIFPLQLLGVIVLLPVLTVNRGSRQLPKVLRYFDNADMYIGRDTSVYDSVRDSGIWNQFVWLALRNPLNYFGYTVLGTCPQTSIEALEETISSERIGDTTSPGFYHAEALIDGRRYFEYYWIYKYNMMPKYCFRLRLGHKLKYVKENKLNNYIQWVCVISPFHSYTGI